MLKNLSSYTQNVGKQVILIVLLSGEADRDLRGFESGITLPSKVKLDLLLDPIEKGTLLYVLFLQRPYLLSLQYIRVQLYTYTVYYLHKQCESIIKMKKSVEKEVF